MKGDQARRGDGVGDDLGPRHEAAGVDHVAVDGVEEVAQRYRDVAIGERERE